ncbi:MAG: T9SS type A sorting domain-containing protein, partial [Ignavibacteria bacterium]|nr:T9SS type A sorting domain-containing protein [Ignavibacteria bacterium]
ANGNPDSTSWTTSIFNSFVNRRRPITTILLSAQLNHSYRPAQRGQFTASLSAQWSTSTYAESALYVCPGLCSNAIVADDGSSIIAGILSNYIYVQKLDPYGNKIWSQPVLAHHNDSTDTPCAEVISDANGGAILIWQDHRNAIPYEFGYFNDAVYMQRVDSNGLVKWSTGGILVSPTLTGHKFFSSVTDGSGGIISAWVEAGYNYQDAPNRSNLRVVRYDAGGNKLWERVLDSLGGTQMKMFYRSTTRVGRFVYIDYWKVDSLNREQYMTRILDSTSISPTDSLWLGYFANVGLRDSILFSLGYGGTNTLAKVSNDGTILWKEYFLLPGCQPPSPFRNSIIALDKRGNISFVTGCGDTVVHFSNSGMQSNSTFPGIDTVGGFIFSDGQGGIVLANENGLAQRYDSAGSSLWGSPIIYVNDPQNVSPIARFFGDNNGGILITYWTTGFSTPGGIHAIHTGRNGRVGIITGVRGEVNLPQHFELKQNFPNPFNPKTVIQYSLPTRANVELSIYDLLGRKVMTLHEGVQDVGTYSFQADLAAHSSGIYLYRIKTESFTQTRTMMLLK